MSPEDKSGPAESSAGLQVIVCGLPRTGTTSIKLALQQLGYHNVYHMSTFVDHTEDYRQWQQVIKAKIAGRETPRAIWDGLLGGYQAIIDAPGCYFAIELARVYPNAKVVILNRNSEKWYDSFAGTVQKMIKRRESLEFLEIPMRPLLSARASAIIRVGNLLSRSGVGLGSYDKEECLKFFHEYYANCRLNIEPERCIELKVQDGWSPLCKHLGVPVPVQASAGGQTHAPFPQANDTESFHLWAARTEKLMMKETVRNILAFILDVLAIVIAIKVVAWLRTGVPGWASYLINAKKEEKVLRYCFCPCQSP
ncbi:hypothetical protein F4802DRAFT_602974 [Xylaria palmicola]|nr:hypothetical protein F4802DRAFT_602974 [Xylaria palmicola]